MNSFNQNKGKIVVSGPTSQGKQEKLHPPSGNRQRQRKTHRISCSPHVLFVVAFCHLLSSMPCAPCLSDSRYGPDAKMSNADAVGVKRDRKKKKREKRKTKQQRKQNQKNKDDQCSPSRCSCNNHKPCSLAPFQSCQIPKHRF
jgi:hypothetical protein